MKKLIALPLAVFFAGACSESTAPASIASTLKPAHGEITTSSTFSDDFEGLATNSVNAWGLYNIGAIPSGSTYTVGGQAYLGPFTNQQQTLTYPYIAGASLNYDLYIIGTWDGLATHKYGADTWRVAASCNGSIVYQFTTSFSNKRTTKQNFPDPIGGGAYGGRTGALTGVTLDMAADGTQLVTNKSVSSYDAIYHNQAGLSVPASALAVCTPGTNVTFEFGSPSQTLQVTSDESWGLDNVIYQ